MQMLYFLASMGAHVGKHPIATLLDAHLLGDPHHELQQGMALATLPEIELVERGDVVSRHNQDVLGSFGVEVAKGDEIPVF
jgi:hypothetical protein